MGTEFDKVESCLSIPHGLLQRLSLDPSLASVVTCLERYYEDKLSYESLMLESEANARQNMELKSELEQNYAELRFLQEKDVQNSNEILKNSSEISDLTIQKNEAKQQLATLNLELKKSNTERESASVENQMLQGKLHDLLNEIQYKSDNMTQIYKDLEEWRSKYQDIHNQNRMLRSEIDSLQIKLRVGENSEILESRNTIENKFKEMKEQFTIAIDKYNDELCKKDSEIDSLKIELRCREKKFELIQAESTFLKEFKVSITQKCENFNNKVAVIENRYSDTMSSLESRIDLIEKYFKTQYDANVEIGSKMNKYLGVIQELKEKVQTLTLEKFKLNEDMQKIMDEQLQKTKEFQRSMSISQNEISLLKSMVQNADTSLGFTDNDLTREIMGSDSLLQHFSSPALTTSKIMPKGLTLTDIYAEYVREHQELVKLQSNNHLADQQLKKLLTELDIIKKKLSEQQLENQSLTSLNQSLVNSLSESKTENLTLNSKLRDINKQNKMLESNIQRLNNLKIDLNAQIQMLLYQVENFKDKLPSTSYDELVDTSVPFFTSITELQTVNCQLLEMIHELEAEINSRTNDVIGDDSACAYHREQLTLKEAEIKQANEILGITIKEKDMYRMLYQYSTGIKLPDQDAIILKNYVQTSSTEIPEKIASENSDLKKCIEKKETEMNLLKKQHSQEILDLKNENARKDKLLKDSNSMISNFESQNRNLITNIQSLEAKVVALNDLISTLENLNKEATKDGQKTKMELEGLKSAYRALVNESESFQMLIKNLRVENQLLYDERLKYQPLTEQLRDMSAQLHQLDSMYKSEKNSHIESLKKDIINLKDQLVSIASEFTTRKTDILNEIESLKNRLFIERSQHENTLNKLELAEKTLAALQNAPTATNIPEDQIKTTQTIIQNHIKEISDLQSQLDNYKKICAAAESKFLDITSEMDEFKNQFQTSQTTWNRDREDYLKTIADLQRESDDFKETIESLRQNQTALSSQSVSHTECVDKLSKLSQENNNLSEQYSNSVLAHSESLRKINELKSQLSTYQSENEKLQAKLAKLHDETKILSKNYAEKCKEIEEFNIIQSQDKNANQQELDILYDQVKKLRKQLDDLQNNIGDSTTFFRDSKFYSLEQNSILFDADTQEAASKTEIADRSNISVNEDVWKLLEFIRTEKTLIAGRLEISQTECARLSTKCAQLYDMINSLESSLQIERDMRLSEGKLDDITHYKDVIENLEISQKENVNLKSELQKNVFTISELSNQIKNYEVKQKDLVDQVQNLKNSYEEKFANTELLSRQLESAKHNISALNTQLKQYQVQNNKLQKLENTTTELIKCQSDIQEYKAKEISYLSLIDKLKADTDQLKTSLLSKNSENEKLRSSLNSLKEKLLKARITTEAATAITRVHPDQTFEKDERPISALSQEDKQTPLVIPPPKARKKVALSSLPQKISNIDKYDNVYAPKEADPKALKSADTVSVEGSEKSESTQFSSINTSNAEITPNLSMLSEKEKVTKLESRQPITGPVAQSTTQGSRFGLSRNVLKKDDVVVGKSNVQSIEPPSISRFKTILESSNGPTSPTFMQSPDKSKNTANVSMESIDLSNVIKTEDSETLEPGEIVASARAPIVAPSQSITQTKRISLKPRPQKSQDLSLEEQVPPADVSQPVKVDEPTIESSEDIPQVKPDNSREILIQEQQFCLKLDDKQDQVMEPFREEPSDDKPI